MKQLELAYPKYELENMTKVDAKRFMIMSFGASMIKLGEWEIVEIGENIIIRQVAK